MFNDYDFLVGLSPFTPFVFIVGVGLLVLIGVAISRGK
jgi:hypothetical protein